MFCFRVLIEASKFAAGKARMLDSTRKLLEAGKLPEREEDLSLIPSTYYSYKRTSYRLMGILSKELGRDIRVKDLFAFGTMEIVDPQPNIGKWLTDHVISPGVR